MVAGKINIQLPDTLPTTCFDGSESDDEGGDVATVELQSLVAQRLASSRRRRIGVSSEILLSTRQRRIAIEQGVKAKQDARREQGLAADAAQERKQHAAVAVAKYDPLETELENLLSERLQCTRDLYTDIQNLHNVLLGIDAARSKSDPRRRQEISDSSSLLGLPVELLVNGVASHLDGVSLTRLAASCIWLRTGLLAYSEVLYRSCVVREFIPADWIPSLPVVVLAVRSRWRNTYKGLHLKVNHELPRLERVLRALKVLRADPLTHRSSQLLSIGREVLEKRKLSGEMHDILSKRCAALTITRDSRIVEREEWLGILHDPCTKNHCRDIRQDVYKRLAAGESHCEQVLSLVTSSRKLLAAVFTGVHELLRKSMIGSGTFNEGGSRRRVNALQMLEIHLCGLLQSIASSNIAPMPICSAGDTADWPNLSPLGWALRNGADVSVPLAISLQALQRGCKVRSSFCRRTLRRVPTKAAGVELRPTDTQITQTSAVRYDAGLKEVCMQRESKGTSNRKRRRRQKKRVGTKPDQLSDEPTTGAVSTSDGVTIQRDDSIEHIVHDIAVSGAAMMVNSTFRILDSNAQQSEFFDIATAHGSQENISFGESEDCKGSETLLFGDFDHVDEDGSSTSQVDCDDESFVLDKIGNQLFELIHPRQPVMAAKIAGMLLENDVEDLNRLIKDQDELDATIEQAVRVLRESMLVDQHWAHLITEPNNRSPLRGKPLQDARLHCSDEETERFNFNSSVGESEWIREQEHMARCFYTQEEYERYCVTAMEEFERFKRAAV
eukprot:SAG31_NODE_248_length_19104_cov_3.721019_1_plen_784_part_00